MQVTHAQHGGQRHEARQRDDSSDHVERSPRRGLAVRARGPRLRGLALELREVRARLGDRLAKRRELRLRGVLGRRLRALDPRALFLDLLDRGLHRRDPVGQRADLGIRPLVTHPMIVAQPRRRALASMLLQERHP